MRNLRLTLSLCAVFGLMTASGGSTTRADAAASAPERIAINDNRVAASRLARANGTRTAIPLPASSSKPSALKAARCRSRGRSSA